MSEGQKARTLDGKGLLLFSILALLMILWSIYYTVVAIETYRFRMVHLAFLLALVPLLFPVAKAFRGRVHPIDILTGIAGVAALVYPFTDFERFIYGSTTPTLADIVAGVAVIFLVLEAVRRATGLVLPSLLIFFLAYTYLGPWIPPPFTHRGYGIDRIVGHMFMTLEGIFGVGVDVSASFVLLFVVYGAVMDVAGGSRFFLDVAHALMGKSPASAGRATVLATGLLGGPQASGVATTLSVGPLVKPYLSQAGYSPEKAAGLLSAGGIGAVISPPVMGAAAFLIIEFLKVSFFEVLLMVTIPTLLFYIDLLAIVEFEAKALNLKPITMRVAQRRTLARNAYHLLSLIVLVWLIAIGHTPNYAVFWAIVTVVATSFLSGDREEWLTPRRIVRGLVKGVMDFVPVGALLASVGIIIGAFTLTGLGLKVAGIIVSASLGIKELALIFSAAAIIIVGLAVPITASYVITVVTVAPALLKLGVPDYVSHMFVFYYAVLSEVSPPIGLSPMAAASIIGANPFRAMMQAWRYSLPVFLVPFFFSTIPQGYALLLVKSSPQALVLPLAMAIVAIILLAAARAGYLLTHMSLLERILIGVSGTLIGIYSNSIEAAGIGAVLLALVVLWQRAKKSKVQEATVKSQVRTPSATRTE